MDKRLQNPVTFEAAVRYLSDGGICAFPTDTVYGLGARSDSSQAINRLFEAKKRPRSRAVIALCADLEQVEGLVEVDPVARKLADFWPGALTLVLPVSQTAPIVPEMHSGLESLGVRIPADPQALELIRAVGVPLATSSANISGRSPPVGAAGVIEQFDAKVPVLAPFESRALPPNPPLASTILKVQAGEVHLLRLGAITPEQIKSRLGLAVRRNFATP